MRSLKGSRHRVSDGGDLFDFMQQREFLWVTDFAERASESFYANFMEMESDPTIETIPIYINSYGGSLYSLTAIRDLVKSSNKPVATICVGMAMSAGSCLLAAGTKGARFAAPNSRIMIHEVSTGSQGKNSDIQNDAQLTKELNEMFMNHIAEDCGMSVEKLKAMIHDNNHADLFLTAKQAKKMGMIDHIVIPRTYHQQESAHLAIISSLDEEIKKTNPKRKKAINGSTKT